MHTCFVTCMLAIACAHIAQLHAKLLPAWSSQYVAGIGTYSLWSPIEQQRCMTCVRSGRPLSSCAVQVMALCRRLRAWCPTRPETLHSLAMSYSSAAGKH